VDLHAEALFEFGQRIVGRNGLFYVREPRPYSSQKSVILLGRQLAMRLWRIRVGAMRRYIVYSHT
jgi:hypothetical protein